MTSRVSLLVILTCLSFVYGWGDPYCVPSGTTLQVKWTTGGANSLPNSDWIGIYPQGSCTSGTCPSGSTAWSYITVSSTSGSTSIPIPSSTPPGLYNVYYLLLSSAPYTYKTVVLDPNPIMVGTCNTTTISAAPVSGGVFMEGIDTMVKWTNAPGTTQDDWIAYFTSSVPSSGTLVQGSWAYTYGGTVKMGKPPDQTGSVTLTTPSSGTFFLFYCLNNGYTCTTSQEITVTASGGGTLTLSSTTPSQSMIINATWSGMNSGSKNDWIGFFTSTSYTHDTLVNDAWVFTYGGQTSLDFSPPSQGTIAVPVPALVGTYYIAYCQQGGYTCYNSKAVTVVATPAITTTCRKSPQSSIQHIVLVVPENHSFDSIFGRYCTAKTGSKPTCNTGPQCCEAAPDTVDGVSPTLLDDNQNDNFDPDHSQAGMLCENNQGKVDKFIRGCSGSNPSNFAIASSKTAPSYYTNAAKYAISDNFFQSVSGGSSANNMYFVSGKFLFTDNVKVPLNSSMTGSRCYSSGFASYSQTTILDLLQHCGFSWKVYGEGWDLNPSNTQCYPYFFDSSDFGASYFPTLTQNPGENWRDFSQFAQEVSAGTLPVWSYIKGLGINSEHPGEGTLQAGANIIDTVVNAVMKSETYSKNTLIIWTPDESGGYYDHINPPGVSVIDGQPYGPRTTLVAIGYAAKTNWVSHVQMEPSSIIKFVEWNWLGATGQLGVRDTVVANIGSLLDSNRTGVIVPDF